VTIQVRGMSRGEKASAAKTTADMAALPATERAELNAETDRRFWARTQYKPGQRLGTGLAEEGERDFAKGRTELR
jgi:hypothetical protein